MSQFSWALLMLSIHIWLNDTHTVQLMTPDLRWTFVSQIVLVCCISIQRVLKDVHNNCIVGSANYKKMLLWDWQKLHRNQKCSNWSMHGLERIAGDLFIKHRSWGDPPYHLNIMSCFGPFWNVILAWAMNDSEMKTQKSSKQTECSTSYYTLSANENVSIMCVVHPYIWHHETPCMKQNQAEDKVTWMVSICQ